MDAAASVPPPRRKHAFATMLTDDSFLPGAQLCIASVLAHSPAPDAKLAVPAADHIPFVVMVTSNVSKITRARLRRMDANVRIVDVAALPVVLLGTEVAAAAQVRDSLPDEWQRTGYTKLAVWSLTEFDKVLYIDADAVAVADVRELFSREIADDCVCAAPDVFPPDKFNAGVMLLRPSQAVFEDMLRRTHELPSYDGGDTGFLNAYFRGWYTRDAAHRLPFAYNAQRTLHWMTAAKAPGYWDACKPLKIIHFSSSPKPWAKDARKGELELLWWQMFIALVGGGPSVGCLISESAVELSTEAAAASSE